MNPQDRLVGISGDGEGISPSWGFGNGISDKQAFVGGGTCE